MEGGRKRKKKGKGMEGRQAGGRERRKQSLESILQSLALLINSVSIRVLFLNAESGSQCFEY